MRFHFREESEVLPVLKSHVCVRMEQEAWWLQRKNYFSWFKMKKIRQDIFEILGSLHTVLRSRLQCVSCLLKVLSLDLDDIFKPDYFGKEVQNGYRGTFQTRPIGHVQLFKHCPKGPQ